MIAWRAVTVWFPFALGMCFTGIEIAIEIGIDSDSATIGFFFYRIATLPQSAQHCRHSIQPNLPLPTLMLVQTLAHDQDILNHGTLQDRTAGNLEISSSIRLSGLAISFGDIQRNRLACPQPLATHALRRTDSAGPWTPLDARPRRGDLRIARAQGSRMSCATRFVADRWGATNRHPSNPSSRFASRRWVSG